MSALLAVHAPAVSVVIPMMLGAGSFTFGLAPLVGSSFRRSSQIGCAVPHLPSFACSCLAPHF